uniref:Uncharacterized protein n=1 Tax=Cannabis sativa TaxID=3483 RepID=A0A803PRE7_CANSA
MFDIKSTHFRTGNDMIWGFNMLVVVVDVVITSKATTNRNHRRASNSVNHEQGPQKPRTLVSCDLDRRRERQIEDEVMTGVWEDGELKSVELGRCSPFVVHSVRRKRRRGKRGE